MTTIPMNRRGRRALGRFALASVAASLLTGCTNPPAWLTNLVNGAGTAAGSAAVQQVLADLQGGLTALSTVVNGAASYLAGTTVALSDGTRTSIQNAISAARSGVASLIQSAAALAGNTGASAVQKVGFLLKGIADAAVAVLGGVKGAGVYLTLAQTVDALLPGVFAFVASIIPSSTVVGAAMGLQIMTVAEARAALGIVQIAP